MSDKSYVDQAKDAVSAAGKRCIDWRPLGPFKTNRYLVTLGLI